MEQKSLFSDENIKRTKPTVCKPAQQKVYTVSQVNTLIKAALENHLPARMIIAAEISGFKQHRSGHCYFDLKDENSVLPAVMWKSAAAKLKFAPENGLAVTAKGYVDVYPPQGKYQFHVETMSPAGTGELQLAFEQMRKKLEAMGLFDKKHKKPLPKFPQRIAILTSESGAALHDITEGIFSRWPVTKLLLYPVPVQGDGAAEKIAEAIKNVNSRNLSLKVDLLIVGRGGGSMEDLLAFNQEPLAMAIFDSKIPVISAVGHEVDVTISDLVADERASTPTRAAVIAVPDANEILEKINAIENRLKANAKNKFDMAIAKLKTILASAVFRNPVALVNNKAQLIDERENKLIATAKQIIKNTGDAIRCFHDKLSKIEPHMLISQKKVFLNNLQNQMNVLHLQKIAALAAALDRLENRETTGLTQKLAASKLQLESQAARLAGLNPKSVLERGYSITKNSRTGAIIKNTSDVNIDDILITELKDNILVESRVTKK